MKKVKEMLEEEEIQKEGNLVFARYPTEDQEIPEFGFLFQSGKGPVYLTFISAYREHRDIVVHGLFSVLCPKIVKCFYVCVLR